VFTSKLKKTCSYHQERNKTQLLCPTLPLLLLLYLGKRYVSGSSGVFATAPGSPLLSSSSSHHILLPSGHPTSVDHKPYRFIITIIITTTTSSTQQQLK